MFCKILFLALVVSFVIGDLKFNNCPSPNMGPSNSSDLIVKYIKIEGCKAFPCNLTIGKGYVFEMKIKLYYPTKRLLASLYIIAGNTTQKLTHNLDVCEHLNILEPCDVLKPGIELTGRKVRSMSDFGISSLYTFRVILTEETGSIRLFCGELVLLLKPPEKSNGTNFERNVRKWLYRGSV